MKREKKTKMDKLVRLVEIINKLDAVNTDRLLYYTEGMLAGQSLRKESADAVNC